MPPVNWLFYTTGCLEQGTDNEFGENSISRVSGQSQAEPSFWEVEALLSRRLYDLKHRLSLTFKINSTVAISETGIVGDVVVSAVITVWGLVVRCQTASLA
jgi:hypothetical protein